jgi:hypothetical protein
MKSKSLRISLFFAVCALASLIDGAILGADDGTVARIERELPFGLKTVLTLLGNVHSHDLSGWFYILYVLPATFFIVNKHYSIYLALALALIHALAAAVTSQAVVRLSTMYIGDGSILSFLLGSLFWWFLVLTINMVAAFCFASLFWVFRALARSAWQLAQNSFRFR